MEIVIAVLQTGLYQNIFGILFKGLINLTHSHFIFVWNDAGVQNVFFPAMLVPVYCTASSFFLSFFIKTAEAFFSEYTRLKTERLYNNYMQDNTVP
jgi:hypothetical protein